MNKIYKCYTLIIMLTLSMLSHAESHKMKPGDLELQIKNMEIVNGGKSIFSEKCSACHGGSGIGTGRAPCVTCGKFMFRGNTNSEIYATIHSGSPRNGGRGGKMGAFSSILTHDEIVSLVTYIRYTERKRIETGEIVDPYANKQEVLEFPK